MNALAAAIPWWLPVVCGAVLGAFASLALRALGGYLLERWMYLPVEPEADES